MAPKTAGIQISIHYPALCWPRADSRWGESLNIHTRFNNHLPIQLVDLYTDRRCPAHHWYFSLLSFTCLQD